MKTNSTHIPKTPVSKEANWQFGQCKLLVTASCKISCSCSNISWLVTLADCCNLGWLKKKCALLFWFQESFNIKSYKWQPSSSIQQSQGDCLNSSHFSEGSDHAASQSAPHWVLSTGSILICISEMAVEKWLNPYSEGEPVRKERFVHALEIT